MAISRSRRRAASSSVPAPTSRSKRPQIFACAHDTAPSSTRCTPSFAPKRPRSFARRIATTATVITQNAERFELTATRLIEKTRTAFATRPNSAGKTQSGATMRTIVKGVYSLLSKRTAMTSHEDTSLDGTRILLG